MNVRTRFPPSPTGKLHLGNIRTAYFNWLYAKKHGGEFCLRIEDTDAQRNIDPSEILETLKWLGLDYDGPVVYQSANIDKHVQIAHEIERRGFAYRCYLTPEEMDNHRSSQGRLSSPWRNNREHINRPYTLRFMTTRDRELVLRDLVQGEIKVHTKSLDDFALLRSNGTPTYLLANACDDHEYGITHVIRGADHVTNTFHQLLIYQAMGWNTPEFAHLPLVHDIQGKKLSKRNESQTIGDLKARGYLPEAICNALLRMGWAYKDEEIVDKKRAIELFDFADVNRSSARFDPAKLDHLNQYYMQHTSHLWEICPKGAWNPDDEQRALKLLQETAKRTKTLNELVEKLEYCKADFVCPNELGALAAPVAKILAACTFTEEGIEKALREFAEANSIKFGPQLAQPLRKTITGSTTSPSLFYVMMCLGKDLVLKRVTSL